jgi:8-oxo-dGTP pyrophosphatase MutT (NUDIX family)
LPRNGYLWPKDFEMALSHIRQVARIEAHLEDWDWEWSVKNRSAIATYWQSICGENKDLYDGFVLLMHQGGIEGDIYRSRYFKTQYSNFLALRDWGQPDKSVRNGFSCAALQTLDGAFLLGVMGTHTSNAGKIYFPAGTPDLNDCIGNRVDLAGSAARELIEETGFGPDQVIFDGRITLVDEALRVAFLCHAQLKMTAQDAVAYFRRWQSQQSKPELADLHVVRTKHDLIPARMHPYLLDWFSTILID